MRKQILTALAFVMTVFGACSGGTQTCTITGLTQGSLYTYSYIDDLGHSVGGDFIATGPSVDIPNVPNSAGCDISLVEIDLPLAPPVV